MKWERESLVVGVTWDVDLEDVGIRGFEPVHEGRRSWPFTEDRRAQEEAPEGVYKKRISHGVILLKSLGWLRYVWNWI